MSRDIKAALQNRSVNVRVSPAGKIIKKFDSSTASKPLLNFLRLHPSCRIVFNAMIKSGFVNLPDTLARLKNMAKDTDVSFIIAAMCKKCKNILDLPNLADSNFKIRTRKKPITCPKCGTPNIITSSNYVPFFETLNKENLRRVLKKGEEIGLFTLYATIECTFCGSTDTLLEKDMKRINLKCPKCSNPREVLIQRIPTHLNYINSLRGNGQGYWLEWYVWKLISNDFPAEPGLKLLKDKQMVEADVVCFARGKLLIVECKDSGDIGDFLEKLPLMGEIADKVFLVTTRSIRSHALAAARKILGKKFIYIHPKKLENICKIIAKS